MRNNKLLVSVIIVLLIVSIIQLTILIYMRGEAPRSAGDPHPIVQEQPEDPPRSHPPPEPEIPPIEQDVIATVGQHLITEHEIRELAYKKYGMEILSQELDHIVVRLEGEALGIQISEAELAHELKRMQAGYDSEESFYRVMKDLGMDRESLRDEAYYKLLSERIATHGIYISEAWIDQYMQEYPEEFRSFTKMRIHLIVSATLDQANTVKQELQNGVAFEEVARSRSIDDLTRGDGGDLGWVEEDDPFIDQRILQYARELKVNEISPVFAIEDGFAIIKLTARNDMDKQASDQIREDVRRQLALQEAPSLQQILRQLREKYQVNILK